MIQVSDELTQIIQAGGGFDRQFIIDVIVDGDRKMQAQPLAAGSFTSDGTARIRNQGTGTFVYSDELGGSIIPTDLTSWMVPYATYVNLSMLCTLGTFSEAVLLGRLKLVGVSDPEETKVQISERVISVGSSLGLSFADAFAVTDREDFPVVGGPTHANAWDEIADISGLALLRNVADVAIPSSLAYQQNRLDVVLALGTVLGGTPYINPAGQITLEPDAWGDETEELTIGPDGTIVDVAPDDLTDQGIYNQVVVTGQASDQTPIVATSELDDPTSPLRYGGPFGRIPYFASSQYIDTQEQAQAYADSLLPKVSQLPAAAYVIQCAPDPRREVGDVIPFQRLGEQLVGRITKRQLADTGPMTLTVSVDRG